MLETIARLLRGLRALLSGAILLLLRLIARSLAWSRMGGFLNSISIPRLAEQRGRTLITVAGIALGVSVLVAVSAVNRAILRSISETIRDVAGTTDLQVQAGASGFDETLLDQVRAVPGVRAARPVLEQTIRVRLPRGADERVLLLGLDLLNERDGALGEAGARGLERVQRDPIAFLNATDHILLSHQLAERVGATPGQRLLVRTPRGSEPFESWGTLRDDRFARAFGGSVALMDYAAMQIAFERGRNIDRIDISVVPRADTAEVTRAIRSRIGPAFFVGKPEHRGQKAGKLVASLSGGLTLASLVAVLVGMFLIASTMAIGVTQRRHEIGVLRALGMTRSDVITLFALEAAVLGCAGSALGVGLGVGLGRAIMTTFAGTVSELFVQVAVPGLGVDLTTLGLCWALGVLSSLVAASIPATLAARVAPIEALTRDRRLSLRPGPERRLVKDGAALALLALSLLLLRTPFVGGPALSAALSCVTTVLGMTMFMPRLVRCVHVLARLPLRLTGGPHLVLANDNLLREIDRISLAASALMVGVAMSLSFASFVDSFVSSALTWVDQMLPADLWISSSARMAGGSSVPMSDSLYGQLKQLRGVESVERVRMVDVDVGALRAKLIATDLDALGRRARLMMLDGPADQAKVALSRGDVLISENLAQRLGLRRGDEIALAGGEGQLRLRVAGVIVDYTSEQGSILIARATYVARFRDERVDTYKIYARPGASIEALRSGIAARWGERLNLSILMQHEFRAQIHALLQRTFGLMHGLELIAVLIAVLGVINAIAANVLDRAREYGVLRAVGMLRRQLSQMVVVEAALLGVAGAFAGMLAGLAIGYVLLFHLNVAQTGWHLPYQPTLTSALAAALPVICAAALAGLWPARWVAAQPVASALAYE